MNEDVKSENLRIHSRADELIACLEGEIAERDARIVELESDLAGTQSRVLSLQDQWRKLDAELAAIKAQSVVLTDEELCSIRNQVACNEVRRDDDSRTICVKHGRALETAVLARLNAAPAQHPKCKTCDDNGLIGGPSFYSPDEGGEPCPDCCSPVQQVSVPDERSAFEREDRYIVIKRSDMDRIPNQKVVHSFLGALGELSAHSVRIPQRKFLVIESDWPEYDPAWKLIQDRVQGRPILDAAPAAPEADVGIVDMYRHLQKVTPYRFKKIQDASITDGGDVMYFHKDRFDAALLADMAAHCAAKGVV